MIFQEIIQETGSDCPGGLVEMSRNGLKIKKSGGPVLTDKVLTVQTPYRAIKAELVWQDSSHAGFKITDVPDIGSLSISPRTATTTGSTRK